MAYTNQQITDHINSLKSSGLTGQALENQIYQDASSYGVSAGQVASALGTTESNINNWVTSNNKSPLLGSTSSTSASTPSAVTTSGSQAATGLLQAYTPTTTLSGSNYSGPEVAKIQDHISWLRDTQGLTGSALENQIYMDAQKYGVGANQIEAAMGWNSGTVTNWLDQNSLPTLTADGYVYKAPTTWQAASPALYQVQSNQTVAGQLNDILAQDSPLMQRAKYQGLATANSRGLLNSSLAAGAAQASMIDSALPIAQQDAQTYFTQSRANQDAENQFNLTNLQYLQDAEQNAYNTNAQLAQTMAETRLTQSSGLYAQFIQGMADINSSDMDQSAKDVALRSLWETINKGTELASSLANVSFSNGQLVYGTNTTMNTTDVTSSSGVGSSSATRTSDQPSIYWGDGGYYAANITRNSTEQPVDKDGKTNPDPDNPNAYYLNSNGAWTRTYINNTNRD